jgi:endogenous inhibitor of DNA gyrase (YacG/DUF329 family)
LENHCGNCGKTVKEGMVHEDSVYSPLCAKCYKAIEARRLKALEEVGSEDQKEG